jgi:predicted secreted protein
MPNHLTGYMGLVDLSTMTEASVSLIYACFIAVLPFSSASTSDTDTSAPERLKGRRHSLRTSEESGLDEGSYYRVMAFQVTDLSLNDARRPQVHF